MRHHDPLVLHLHHGPLTAYVTSFDGCPVLSSLVRQLPSEQPVVWLDSARTHPVTGRWSLLGWSPWLTLTSRDGRLELRTSAATHRWHGDPFEALRDVLHRYRAPSREQVHGRVIGLFGFLNYDLNRWIEALPAPQAAGTPALEMAWWAMKRVVLVDHLERRSWVASVVDPHVPAVEARRAALEMLGQVVAQLGTGGAEEQADAIPEAATRLEATSTQQEFEGMVAQALEHIRAGDIFQANVSQRFTGWWPGQALPLYDALRRANPSPFACFVRDGEWAIVSCSPERLARVQDGRIDTRPIAGTRPRGATPEDDAMQSLELLLSEKERAEHIMLVDLARNDLGRVCRAGTVQVDELMALEAYSHVIHIVSDVTGLLRCNVDAVDVIRAVFPGGTITGCPKVRCMQILRELEPVARGLYTGSVGLIGFDGTMDLNIAIRTLVLDGHRVSFHVGAGIVADSDPMREYHETLAKAAALMAALRVSLRVRPGPTHAVTR